MNNLRSFVHPHFLRLRSGVSMVAWLALAACACMSPVLAEEPVGPTYGFHFDVDLIPGHLGVPLGTPAKIDANFVTGSVRIADRPASDDPESREVFLSIRAIDGRSLESPLIMRFRILEYSNAEIDNSLKKTMKRLTRGSEEALPPMEVVEKFLARQRRFVVWEGAYTTGHPPVVPKEVRTASVSPFVCWSYLTIGAQLLDENTELNPNQRRSYDPQTLTPLLLERHEEIEDPVEPTAKNN